MKPSLAVLAVIAFIGFAAASAKDVSADSSQHDPPKLGSMSHVLEADRQRVRSGMQLLLHDALAGQTGGKSETGCYNLRYNVDAEAANIAYLVDNQVTNDVTVLQRDIDTLRADLRNFRSDIADFVNDGVPAPAGAPLTAAMMRKAIANEVRRENSVLARLQFDVNHAFSRADALATGHCSGDGPGSPPTVPMVR